MPVTLTDAQLQRVAALLMLASGGAVGGMLMQRLTTGRGGAMGALGGAMAAGGGYLAYRPGAAADVSSALRSVWNRVAGLNAEERAAGQVGTEERTRQAKAMQEQAKAQEAAQLQQGAGQAYVARSGHAPEEVQQAAAELASAKQQKATTQFVKMMGRQPTEAELAQIYESPTIAEVERYMGRGGIPADLATDAGLVGITGASRLLPGARAAVAQKALAAASKTGRLGKWTGRVLGPWANQAAGWGTGLYAGAHAVIPSWRRGIEAEAGNRWNTAMEGGIEKFGPATNRELARKAALAALLGVSGGAAPGLAPWVAMTAAKPLAEGASTLGTMVTGTAGKWLPRKWTSVGMQDDASALAELERARQGKWLQRAPEIPGEEFMQHQYEPDLEDVRRAYGAAGERGKALLRSRFAGIEGW